MNRKQFLQIIISVPISASVIGRVGTWLEEIPENERALNFDPTNQYGNWVVLDDHEVFDDKEAMDKIVDIMVRDAQRALPKGTKFGIRLIDPRLTRGTFDPYAEIPAVVWSYPYKDYMHRAIIA